MSTRMTQARLDRLRRELTPEDRAVIAMLSVVKLATGTHLRRATRVGDSPATARAARRQLARLVRWRVVARLERRQGGLGRGSDAWTYALDITGQRLVTRPGVRRPHLPRPAMWAHILLGAEIYTRLIEATRGTDRTVRRWQGEPAAWRSFTGPYGEVVKLKPDAFVEVAGPGYTDVCFVEVDTGSQSRSVIRAKLQTYQRYAASGQEQLANGGVFPLTVFITTTLDRHALLVDLLGELSPDAWRLFAVGLVDDAARLLTRGTA